MLVLVDHFIPIVFLSFLISYIYFFNNKKRTKYLVFSLGIIIDLLFSNILFFNLIKFYLLYEFISFIKSKSNTSFFIYILTISFSFIFSYLINYFLLFIINRNDLILIDIFYLLIKELIILLIVSFPFYILFKDKKKLY